MSRPRTSAELTGPLAPLPVNPWLNLGNLTGGNHAST